MQHSERRLTEIVNQRRGSGSRRRGHSDAGFLPPGFWQRASAKLHPKKIHYSKSFITKDKLHVILTKHL